MGMPCTSAHVTATLSKMRFDSDTAMCPDLRFSKFKSKHETRAAALRGEKEASVTSGR